MANKVILETEDLTKVVQGFIAVKGVRLRVRAGTIHAADRWPKRFPDCQFSSLNHIGSHNQ